MAKPSRRKILTKRRSVCPSIQPPPTNASIEGWIFYEEWRIEFINLWKDKAIITPTFINFLTSGFHLPSLFDVEDIKYFVEMQGTYLPDLVKVFYYIFKYRDGVDFSKVKCVNIILDNDIWESVAKFPTKEDALQILTGIEGFNRLLVYISYGILNRT